MEIVSWGPILADNDSILGLWAQALKSDSQVNTKEKRSFFSEF